MPGQYLYNVDFSIDDYDLWLYPDNLSNPEDLPTLIRFEMNPFVRLEISEEEFYDQVNCDKKIIKHAMFSLNDQQICEVCAKIAVYKNVCRGNDVVIGSYDLSKLPEKFKALMDQFDKQAECSDKSGEPDPSADQTCIEVIKELVQLKNAKDCPTGSLYYTLRLTCFGPAIIKHRSKDQLKKSVNAKEAEKSCLEKGQKPSPCPPESGPPGCDFDEYAAEINGNQLIVRINKDDKSRFVTRVYDSAMDQNGNEIPRDKNVVSLCGCDQQIDFRFPKNFSCDDCKMKSQSCNCGPNAMFTEFQRQTSCVGKSFKNSCRLPVIRGNLKYPGRIDDGSINFDLYDKCNPRDATAKYKMAKPAARGACCQVGSENLKRELDGKCKLPNGIEVCKKGCADPDFDVFVLKIGRKKTDKKGRKNEIELEMRTPKGPDNEIKKMETRECQVDEKDFFVPKKPQTAEGKKADVTARKGFVKKGNKCKV